MTIGVSAPGIDQTQNIGGNIGAGINGPSAVNPAVPVQADPTAPNFQDNWMKGDLQNPFIMPWGQFDVSPDLNFQQILNRAYQEPKKPAFNIPAFNIPANVMGGMGRMGGGIGGMNQQPQTWKNTGAADMFGGIPQPSQSMGGFGGGFGLGGMFGVTNPKQLAAQAQKGFDTGFSGFSNSINFKDPTIDSYIDDLNQQAAAYLRPTPEHKGNSFNVFGQTIWPDDLHYSKHNPAPPPPNIVANSYGWSPLDRLGDTAMRDKMIADEAAKLGISVDDINHNYGIYSKGIRSIYDPVGANWQDLKQAPFYKDELAGIRSYANEHSAGGYHNASTGFGPDYWAKMDAAGGASLDNPYALPPEYFALHDPMHVYPRRGGTGLAGHGYSDIRNSNPYMRQDWGDYADANKAMWQYTPEEMAAAKEAMAHHNVLLNSTPEHGGPFSLQREADVHLPRSKGGKYNWRYAPQMGEFNAAQNYLGQFGKTAQGDAGLDPNLAIKQSLQFTKKKKGKGGLGSFIGPALSIASFAFPEIAPFVSMFNVANSLAHGNPLGALAAGIGGNFGFGAGADGVANTFGSAGSSLAGQAAGGLGSMLASGLGSSFSPETIRNLSSGIISGGLGALSGASSGNALAGALSGGLGGLSNSALGAAGIPSTTAQYITSGASTLANRAYQMQKQKAAYNTYMKNRARGVA